jgi:hypothetical protein
MPLPLGTSFGPHHDLHVVTQRIQEAREPFDGEPAQASAHERTDLRLIDAEDIGRLGLREPALLDDPADLEREIRLGQEFIGVLQPQVGEDVPGTLGELGGVIRFFVAPYADGEWPRLAASLILISGVC